MKSGHAHGSGIGTLFKAQIEAMPQLSLFDREIARQIVMRNLHWIASKFGLNVQAWDFSPHTVSVTLQAPDTRTCVKAVQRWAHFSERELIEEIPELIGEDGATARATSSPSIWLKPPSCRRVNQITASRK